MSLTRRAFIRQATGTAAVGLLAGIAPRVVQGADSKPELTPEALAVFGTAMTALKTSRLGIVPRDASVAEAQEGLRAQFAALDEDHQILVQQALEAISDDPARFVKLDPALALTSLRNRRLALGVKAYNGRFDDAMTFIVQPLYPQTSANPPVLF